MAPDPVMAPDPGDITALLKAVRQGDAAAENQLLPLLYKELHRIAESYMRRERPGHTLQPTLLINEAYLRLTRNATVDWQSRSQFISLAAHVMRRILVDHARKTNAAMRGGGQQDLPLDEAVRFSPKRSDEVVAVNDALEELAKVNPRQARVVELRFFVGLSTEEIAKVLDITPRSVRRDWALARIWLHQAIKDPGQAV